MKKFALLSHILPPSPSGQAVVLDRILNDIDSNDYYLLSRGKYSADNFYPLPPENRLPLISRLGLDIINKQWIAYQRSRSIENFLHRHPVERLVVCSGDSYDVQGAYVACRRVGIKFFLYCFDDYVLQWADQGTRLFAKNTEVMMLRGAVDGVAVPNEFLQRELMDRGFPAPTIIRNPISPLIEKNTSWSWPYQDGEIRIVYTGSIYHAHYDAFRNLVAAIKKLNIATLKLHLYSSQGADELSLQGIFGSHVVHHTHEQYDDVVNAQQQADILFLPLAFECTIPEVIRTSSPGKMGEYLASCRPILVHAPQDSFVSWYFNTHGCGVVIDENSSALLAEGIQRILNDSALRQRIVVNAEKRAAFEFQSRTSSCHFSQWLGLA